MAHDTPAAALNGARWEALTNGHYHSQRESFLDLVDRLITFGVLLSGAAVIVTALDPAAQYVLAVSVTLFGFFQLVFAIGTAARKHASLRDKYFTIAAELELDRLNPSEANSKMLLLAGEESPVYHAVHALSENWAKQAVYGTGVADLCKVVGWRKRFRHLLRQGDHDFHCR